MNTINDNEFIRVAALDNIIETQLLESILKELNIPYRIRSFHDTAYDGLFQFQKGWGELSAPVSFKQEIIDILNDIRSHNHES